MKMDNNDTEFIKRAGEVEIYRPKSLTKTSQDVKSELPKYLTKEQINDALNNMPPGKDKMLCMLLWMTGIRITEAINIRKKDIDFKNNVITIRWQKNKKWKNRNVPMHSTLSSVLNIYCASMTDEEKLFDFTRQRGYQITKQWFGISPHQFRHSFAVHFLRSTGDLITLHRLLGHQRINTTMEYLKIVPIDQARLLEQVRFT